MRRVNNELSVGFCRPARFVFLSRVFGGDHIPVSSMSRSRPREKTKRKNNVRKDPAAEGVVHTYVIRDTTGERSGGCVKCWLRKNFPVRDFSNWMLN